MNRWTIALAGTALLGTLLATPASAATVDFAGTVDLRGCTGSLVRTADSTDQDRALLLTNGHCYEGARPVQDEAIVDQPSHRPFELLDNDGKPLGTLQTAGLVYATMTGTDVALYRLRETYEQLDQRYHVRARELSTERPVPGTDFKVVSGTLREIFSCTLDGFAYRLLESAYVAKDVLRYAKACTAGPGASGSPIVDPASGKVIGIHSTSNRDGETCTENNPCEMDRYGRITVRQDNGYGTQTYWITTCLTRGNRLDLNRPGCLLPD
jgi:V8-like Glu-specific endopeptidase